MRITNQIQTGPRITDLSSAVDSRATVEGVAYALAACFWWGGAVFYFKAVDYVSAAEVVAHRIIWTAVLLIATLAITGRLRPCLRAIRGGNAYAKLSATAALIALSWYSNVWAVANDRVLETSLAYYIMPLVNITLGAVFLKERMRKWQIASVLLASLGVVVQGLSYGRFPIIAVVMSVTFGLYGLLRKQIAVDGTAGLAAETAILTPIALVIMLYFHQQEQLMFAHTDMQTNLLMVAAGAVTVFPLIWYVNATKKLRLSTLGIIIYMVPTITFLASVFVFNEVFGFWQFISFCCIWIALLMFTFESLWQTSRYIEWRILWSQVFSRVTRRKRPG
jgi:chloramphenicol-sensitive protein RarD